MSTKGQDIAYDISMNYLERWASGDIKSCVINMDDDNETLIRTLQYISQISSDCAEYLQNKQEEN